MSDLAAQNRMKMIRYRAWHRGIRETDLILGGFADRHLTELDPALLDEFEVMLDLPDQLIYAWVAGYEEPPPEVPARILSLLQQFRLAQAGDGQPKA